MSMRYDSAVVGLGATGLSCVRHLLTRGERLLVTDSRAEPPALKALALLPEAMTSVEVQLGAYQPASLNQAQRLIFSPGVNRLEPPFAVPPLHQKPATGDIQLFADARLQREQPGALVVVSGTNGKSTVTDLVHWMLKASGDNVVIGGNFGTPALDLLAETDVDAWVLELSSFQLDLVTALHADIAVLLNIGIDHQDRHASFADYTAAKQNIFKKARTCIWNRQQPVTQPPEAKRNQTISVGLDAPARPEDFGLLEVDGVFCLAKGTGWHLPLHLVSLAGAHNAFNALCALAAADALSVDLDVCAKILQTYQGLAHRLQKLGQARGVHFVNDSKATNVDATVAALEALAPEVQAPEAQGAILLLAGGLAKETDFSRLAEAAEGRVRKLACFGKARAILCDAMQSVTECTQATKMDEAFSILVEAAQPGDTVLLSPACASYDQFSDFAARGLAFTKLFEAWAA